VIIRRIKELKLCKDCKYLSVNLDHRDPLDFAKCNAPLNLLTNPVTGDKKHKWIFCQTMRDDSGWFSKSCGKSARWFEPKDKPSDN